MATLLQTPAQLRAALSDISRSELHHSRSVGFVPTMGYLHEGHATLLRQARRENDVVVLSIFVNPLQFAPTEDLSRYPRDLARDTAIAEQEGVDFIFCPTEEEMYPPYFSTHVQTSGVSEPFDGAARPGHFRGVTTIVTKLFNIIQPTRAYFGEKDWQQLAVIRRMVKDLDINIEIIGVPIVRDPIHKGLAQSSRNSYLTEEQKEEARVIYKSLQAVQEKYKAGERNVALLQEEGLRILKEATSDIDYFSIVDTELNEPLILPAPNEVNNWRILIAARLFGVRLIDNAPLWNSQTE